MANILRAAKFIILTSDLLPPNQDYDRYQLRLRLFISCQSTPGQLETTVVMGIYRNSDNYLVQRCSRRI